MGDRVTVTLTIQECHEEQVRTLINDHVDDEWEKYADDTRLVSLVYNDVNYGELSDLDLLRNRGIAYTSRWSAGLEFGEGEDNLRFTPSGEAIQKEIYDSERNPNLDQLMKLIDHPTRLREYILRHKRNVTVPSWLNQKEYGLIYRAKQLICPT